MGITIGCIVGMFPLLFMDTDKKKDGESGEKAKKECAVKQVVVEEVKKAA